jgi:SAM-dependent methyltransferase
MDQHPDRHPPEPDRPPWTAYLRRYRGGEWRSPIFHDAILDDAARLGRDLVFLDIGCGKGFDNDVRLQQSLADAAGHYVGVEPDPEIAVGPHVAEVHRCTFEEAPLEPGSVHVAFSAFVLEHVETPEAFWAKLYDVLVDGGVFWGFTVDARHYFSIGSRMLQRLGLKDRYLKRVRGGTGIVQYENYPTWYRANSPRQIRRHTRRFRHCSHCNFHRVGQLDYYFPGSVRKVARLLDRVVIGMGLPGSVLVVRLEK